MPFIKRSVEPVNIRRGAIAKKSDITLGEEHEAVVNKCFINLVHQLSQVALFANEIFGDISVECSKLIAKTQNLKTRVWELDQKTRELNVLDVHLPESTLEEVGLSVCESPMILPEQDGCLFTSKTRPEPVQKLYEAADITPRAVFASLGPQGYKAAKNFCLTPVFLNPGPTTVELRKDKKKPFKITYERNAKLRAPRPRTQAPRPHSCASILDHDADHPVLSKDTVLKNARSQPSILVPINTSLSSFDRLASSRASLRNLQKRHKSNDENVFSRTDPRRKTVADPADLRKLANSSTPVISTEKLLLTPLKQAQRSRLKNPDLYIQDTAELFDRESRSKERKPSILLKLVQRSRSLPRNLSSSRSKEMIEAPEFYDINPQRNPSNDENSSDGKSCTVYSNFYGVPNTELPPQEQELNFKKSASDYQISERLRSRSQSAIDQFKLNIGSNKRTRSVSAERVKVAKESTEDRKCNSLSRTFTGIFCRNKKSKSGNVNTYNKVQSRESLNTVFTNSSEGVSSKRTVRNTMSNQSYSSHLPYRKRDSKATASSSGRWSGSERFSLDSDGLLTELSQNRLSKHSADRDSAIGADINEMKTSIDYGTHGDSNSLFSVDQEGFYTTMHTDSCLYTAGKRRSLPDLSLVSSSTCTSTKTLNDSERQVTNVSADLSVASLSDLELSEELAERVKSKVNAGQKINRYSLVALDNDSEKFPGDSPPETKIKANIKQSQTYESELDLVLEELSDAETATIHSDCEPIKKLQNPSVPSDSKISSKYLHSVKSYDDSMQNKLDKEDYIAQYNGSTKNPDVQMSEGDNYRSCRSLPRNIKSMVSVNSSLDNMGSWPRKMPIAKTNGGEGKDTSTNTSLSLKRRSLSPGKLKISGCSKPDEQVHNLIEEARRISSLQKNETSKAIYFPNSGPPTNGTLNQESPSSASSSTSSTPLVSPYATVNILDKPMLDSFIRQPSYRMACSNSVSPKKLFPRTQSADFAKIQRNESYKRSKSFMPHQFSDSILESRDQVNEIPKSISRAPSYKLAQSKSFDRSARAPSYRKALENASRDSDSGLEMTSSSESNDSERQSSYRLAVTDSPQQSEGAAPVLHQSVIRDCMKGVYANEERHLASPKIILTVPEIIKISTQGNSLCRHAQADSAIQVSSFSPTLKGRLAAINNKAYLKQSKSDGQESVASTPSRRTAYCRTKFNNKLDRPVSCLIPNDPAETNMMIPDNNLMFPKHNQFTSMEMLKREELALTSILGKIKQSAGSMTFIETDM